MEWGQNQAAADHSHTLLWLSVPSQYTAFSIRYTPSRCTSLHSGTTTLEGLTYGYEYCIVSYTTQINQIKLVKQRVFQGGSPGTVQSVWLIPGPDLQNAFPETCKSPNVLGFACGRLKSSAQRDKKGEEKKKKKKSYIH